MTAFNGYPFSIVLAVLLHCSVLASLFFFQRASTEAIDIIRPPSVRATLVGENPQVKNAQEQQQAQQRRVEEQRAAQRREEEQKQAAARQQQEQQRQEAERRAEQERTALRERQEQERRQAEQRQTAERQAEEQKQRDERERQAREEEQRRQQELAAQQERQRQEQALQAQRDAEASQISAVQAEAVMSYTTVIHDLVQRQWSRPPSARNGMEAVLRISMLPTGDVTDVVVVKSSGDFAFDRAAESAVLRVKRFTELQGMDQRLFDRNFRTFLLTFRPEDLLN